MKSLFTAILLTFGLMTASVADYDSCMHDAAVAREACLRWAAENHAPDSTCIPDYNAAIQACEQLRTRD